MRTPWDITRPRARTLRARSRDRTPAELSAADQRLSPILDRSVCSFTPDKPFVGGRSSLRYKGAVGDKRHIPEWTEHRSEFHRARMRKQTAKEIGEDHDSKRHSKSERHGQAVAVPV